MIEQEGSGRFLFISRQVKLTLKVQEAALARVDFRAIDGQQFKQYQGTWTITGSSDGCSVSYKLMAQPDPVLGPRFAARNVLKKNARRLLSEVRSEIERRAREEGS